MIRHHEEGTGVSDRIPQADNKCGIRVWSHRLHIPVTRMTSCVPRKIEANRFARLVKPAPPPATE